MMFCFRQFILIFCCLVFQTIAYGLPNSEGIQIYQKNISSEEKKQSIAEDINRYHNANNIWDILRQEFSLPHYEDNPIVQEKIVWFLNHQDFLQHSALRAAPYLYFILQQVKKRHLPVELVLLPMIESAYNPFAYSSAGAAGIWQMMPGTASGYGIKQSWWYDGRRDVIASTRAALDHLVYLGTFFEGNWLLATAAYDTGEGNVLAAIRRNNYEGRPTDFWSLPLSMETRDYVPRLLALAAIISHPEKYYIYFPEAPNAPYLAQIDLGMRMDLKHAASLAGLSLKQLMHLNPGFSRSASSHYKGPSKLILPIENVTQFTENLSYSPLYHHRTAPPISNRILELSQKKSIQHPYLSAVIKSKHITGRYSLQPGDTLYMVRKGDDLKKIAKHFQTTPKFLREINGMTAMQSIHVGQKLIIPTHVAKVEPNHKYQLSPGDTIYMVRKTDTMESIAAKFHMTASEIRLANLLASNDVKEGDRLVLPTHG